MARTSHSKQSRIGRRSSEAGQMGVNQVGALAEGAEGFAQRTIPFIDSPVEPVVGRQLAGDLPDRLHGVEIGRVGRQAMQFKAVRVLTQPTLPVLAEVVARAIVGDEEDFPGGVAADEEFEEVQVSLGVEDRCELVGETGLVDAHGTVNVGRLAQPKGIDTRLLAYPGPGAVERAIEPEAGFVFEEDLSAAAGGFF